MKYKQKYLRLLNSSISQNQHIIGGCGSNSKQIFHNDLLWVTDNIDKWDIFIKKLFIAATTRTCFKHTCELTSVYSIPILLKEVAPYIKHFNNIDQLEYQILNLYHNETNFNDISNNVFFNYLNLNDSIAISSDQSIPEINSVIYNAFNDIIEMKTNNYTLSLPTYLTKINNIYNNINWNQGYGETASPVSLLEYIGNADLTYIYLNYFSQNVRDYLPFENFQNININDNNEIDYLYNLLHYYNINYGIIDRYHFGYHGFINFINKVYTEILTHVSPSSLEQKSIYIISDSTIDQSGRINFNKSIQKRIDSPLYMLNNYLTKDSITNEKKDIIKARFSTSHVTIDAIGGTGHITSGEDSLIKINDYQYLFDMFSQINSPSDMIQFINLLLKLRIINLSNTTYISRLLTHFYSIAINSSNTNIYSNLPNTYPKYDYIIVFGFGNDIEIIEKPLFYNNNNNNIFTYKTVSLILQLFEKFGYYIINNYDDMASYKYDIKSHTFIKRT